MDVRNPTVEFCRQVLPGMVSIHLERCCVPEWRDWKKHQVRPYNNVEHLLWASIAKSLNRLSHDSGEIWAGEFISHNWLVV